MAMNPEKKQALEAFMNNFSACCRYLKVTDKMLYEDLLKKSGVQKYWSYEVFKTSLHSHPTCIINKSVKIHEAIDVIHQEMLMDIKNQISRYMEE